MSVMEKGKRNKEEDVDSGGWAEMLIYEYSLVHYDVNTYHVAGVCRRQVRS